jgi:hypothetical protein
MEHRISRGREAARSRPPRRPRHIYLGIAVGFIAAYAIGVAAVWIVNEPLITGKRHDPFTYIFGLPTLIAIAGGVFGALVSVLTYSEEVDAPVTHD